MLIIILGGISDGKHSRYDLILLEQSDLWNIPCSFLNLAQQLDSFLRYFQQLLSPYSIS